jgi:hypothetical protein
VGCGDGNARGSWEVDVPEANCSRGSRLKVDNKQHLNYFALREGGWYRTGTGTPLCTLDHPLKFDNGF